MNSLCTDCTNKDICKIYDFLCKNQFIAESVITKCKHNKNSEHSEEPLVEDSLSAPLLAPKPIKQYTNFRAMAKQAKEEGKKRKPVVSIIKEETTETEALTVCTSCDGTTYVSDIIPCSKCGKDTCSNCRTEVVETGQKLCDNCWSEE